MNIIGLSGYARSGKDTAAEVLVEEFGFTRVAFADKLRDFLYALNPIVEQTHFTTAGLEFGTREIRVRDVIDAHGWNGYKETAFGNEIRSLLQRLGTEAGRETLWDSIWIDAAFHGLDASGNYVITDVRFPNEAEAVRDRAGVLWRITRSGIGPATAEDGTVHKSETSLDDYGHFQQFINNNGTLEEFHSKILLAAQHRTTKK